MKSISPSCIRTDYGKVFCVYLVVQESGGSEFLGKNKSMRSGKLLLKSGYVM